MTFNRHGLGAEYPLGDVPSGISTTEYCVGDIVHGVRYLVLVDNATR